MVARGVLLRSIVLCRSCPENVQAAKADAVSKRTYPLTGKREPPERKEDREKKSDRKAKAYMEMFAMSFNKQFEEKGG